MRLLPLAHEDYTTETVKLASASKPSLFDVDDNKEPQPPAPASAVPWPAAATAASTDRRPAPVADVTLQMEDDAGNASRGTPTALPGPESGTGIPIAVVRADHQIADSDGPPQDSDPEAWELIPPATRSQLRDKVALAGRGHPVVWRTLRLTVRYVCNCLPLLPSSRHALCSDNGVGIAEANIGKLFSVRERQMARRCDQSWR